MKRLLLTIFALGIVAGQSWAQKACVIANAEDHLPLRDVLVHTDNNHWARTDYRGYFTMRYQFDSATVSKPGFVKTTIYLENLPDTVFLLPESKQIGEVTVWGKNQEHIKNMEKQVGEAAADRLPSGSSLFSFNLANMLDGRGRRDNRHLKQAKKVMAGMEKKKDPIIEAYEKATGKNFQLSPTALSESKDSLACDSVGGMGKVAPSAGASDTKEQQAPSPQKKEGKGSADANVKPDEEEKSGRKVKIGYEMEVGW